MRIGLSSFIGDGFGSGSFSFGEVPSGPSCPAAGTIEGYTALQEYPIAYGGSYFSNPLGGGNVPNQNATFAIKADGDCGTYTDYNTTGTYSYKPPGIFATDNASPTVLYVNIGGSDYVGGNSYPAYSHDGSGSYNSVTNTIWYSYGTTLHSVSNQTEVPVSSTNYYNNGTTLEYKSDNNGGYYSITTGSYISAGTLITQNITGETGTYVDINGTYYYPLYTGNRYTWGPSEGGYTYFAEWPKPYGTFITSEPSQSAVPDTGTTYYNNGKTTNYVWEGDGTNYTNTYTGSFYSAGTLVFENVTSTNTISMPSGSSPIGTYYGDKYTWNGSGGYNYASTWYVSNGTFIEEYNGDNYYHDGNGSYYSNPV